MASPLRKQSLYYQIGVGWPAEKLAAPQPSEFDEKLPESSPGSEIVPEEQPYPEPSSKKLPQASPPSGEGLCKFSLQPIRGKDQIYAFDLGTLYAISSLTNTKALQRFEQGIVML